MPLVRVGILVWGVAMIDRAIGWYFEGGWLRYLLAFLIGAMLNQMLEHGDGLVPYVAAIAVTGFIMTLKHCNDRYEVAK